MRKEPRPLSFLNIKSEIRPTTLAFLQRLAGIKYSRQLKLSGNPHAQIDFHESDKLCEEMLDAICETIKRIQRDFPQRVSKCALFSGIDQKKFRANI